ncbi:MAG: 50S ribosomal protein L9 [Bacteroidetes bacterium RIFOXYA12_FULL_35_11]|nr:MAG: 50S ribosomal protein L9 [Bacteroidetes bacterium GWF2_35_48]OFY74787.1 MAG: 50S ribosomal protein L9 [Bacteroidetes bacterium RIFOXYA12_FULL_35_11]OFY92076.1 MAG: 50S ribosomal protein L9 [Bacteroidetes bacterium RIFOXYB2_FULL_35_7]OFY95944.1 MAG: 50S ribosomal protein L9 [Bacteroidetes bacterium RIFOXYC12_FULL_35_7]HBX52140.1 50S ribosomal protein L9 [Bacteroidales bacterium]
MEIILKEDIANLGHKNDIVKVKNGYGRNFLIPKGFATLATGPAKKMHAETMKQRAHKEEKLKETALEMVKKIEKISLKLGAKTSTTGKIFGSVNTIQIAEALKEKGFEIDRKNISIKEEHIKEVGTYTANVKLYKDIKVEISFEVFSE